MAFETLNLGIELTLPTTGTTNWGSSIRSTTWTKISQHGHTGSGDGNQITTSGIQDGAVTSVKLSGTISTWTKASTLTPGGTTQDIDFTNGAMQTLDLGSATGDVTLTFSNSAVNMYLLYVIQGATPRDLIFPANVKWPQGQKILLSTGNGEKDMIAMFYDGTDLTVLTWDLNIS